MDTYDRYNNRVNAILIKAFDTEISLFTNNVIQGRITVDGIRGYWSSDKTEYHHFCGFEDKGKFISTLQFKVRQRLIKLTKNVI